MDDYVVAEGHMKREVRTDLALEEKENLPRDSEEITGVSLREWHENGSPVKLTEVRILDQKGADSMGKPIGTYLTLEAENLCKKDEDYHKEITKELGKQIRELIKNQLGNPDKILVAGLGNPCVTPDSLGPNVILNLQVTRQWNQEFGEKFCKEHHVPELSGIVPGVMAQTGMETAEILQGIIQRTKPQALIAIDALAARSARRLGTTIQLTDTGIHPGSGVGNHRHELTSKSLGIPVLAIGVPTVIGAAAIIHDTIHTMIKTLQIDGNTRQAGSFIENLNSEEQYRLIQELLEPEFGALYVTPPDIDAVVKQLGFTISEAIHEALFDS